MTKVYGNELDFKTFNYLKVNSTEICLPDEHKCRLDFESDKRVYIPEFHDKKYAISKEFIDLNEREGNLYRYYEVKTGEKKDFGILNLNTDNEYTNLYDTHDILAEEDSELRLIIDYSSTGDIEKFRNSIIRILAKKDSKIKLYLIQRENESSISCSSVLIQTEEDAEVEVYQYELGTKKLYTNYQSYIYGDRSSVDVKSIYFTYKDHEMDLLYNIYHYGKESNSDILLNGIMKDNSKKVFKSNLDFKKGCTRSIGSEEEYVLILDNGVRNIAVPILLCHEDDVQGNHAASTGELDKEVMFYLMSRGLSEEEAERIIIESKFSPTIDALENDEIEKEIWDFIKDIIKGGK